MSFPRYPKTKPSGVEWLGDVPEHWRVDPFKRQIDRNDGGVWGDDPDGVHDTIVLRSTEQTIDGQWKLDEPAPRKLSEGEINSSLLIEGDLLLTKSSGSSLHIGKTTLVTDEVAAMRCCYSNFMQRIRTKPSFSPKLAWYVLNNALARRQFDLLSNSSTGLANLNATMVGQIVVIIPPRSEQSAIASFLDHETGKIDVLVEEQRRLIALLKEKRQAVISHAVTKGLNPHAPMKPSGVEWLGDVPAHWEVIALKRIADVQTGVAKGKDNSSRATITVPYLRVANVQDGYLDLETVATMEIPAADLDRYTLKPGDVLMNEGGDFDKLGRGHIWEGQISPCITQNHVFAVRPRLVSSRWLNAITGSNFAQFYFMTRSKQSTNLASISSTNLMELPVIMPPAEEQNAILSFIANKTAQFDTLTNEANRAIEVLQERRTALISAAVTGKIDVRSFTQN